jgi:hypothetical protein
MWCGRAELIEVVQHALPTGIRLVQFGVDDFLFGFTFRVCERESCIGAAPGTIFG